MSIIRLILPSGQEFTFPSKLEKIEMSHYRKLAIGRAFLQWGGFYDLKPVANSPFLSSSSSPSAPERSPDVERQTPIDHVRMRTVLTRWSQLTGRRDPSIPVLTKETSPSGASGPLLDGFIEGMPETITSSVSETDARSMPTENVSVKWDPIQDPDPETLKRLQADSSDIGPQTKRRSRRARREIAKTLTATTTVDADNGSAERVVAEDNRDGQGVAQKKSDGEREVRGKQVNMDGNGFTERLQGLIGKWF